MYYLGIDGGGSKTAFAIIDENCKVLIKIEKETCHYMQVGLEGFKKVIDNGLNEICNALKITKNDINYSFLAVPGYGEVKKDDLVIQDTVSSILENDRFSIGNDVVAGWAGSLACKPGINIVAGTGSIAYGVNEDNKFERTGGWGYFCGDEGSAYWIAKKGIEVFSKQSDERLEKTKIYNVFKDKLNIKEDFDLISLLKDDYKYDRTKVAKLCILVYEAAKLNDESAINIFKEAADELALMVKGILKKVNYKDRILVSYSGGVFNSKEFILEPLKEKLKTLNCELVEPILEPVLGAALYAFKLNNNVIKKEYIDNLKE